MKLFLLDLVTPQLIVQLVHTAQRTERALSVRLACTNHPEESQLVFLAAKTKQQLPLVLWEKCTVLVG